MRKHSILFNSEYETDGRPISGPFSLFRAVVELAKFDIKNGPQTALEKREWNSYGCPRQFLKEWRMGTAIGELPIT